MNEDSLLLGRDLPITEIKLHQKGIAIKKVQMLLCKYARPISNYAAFEPFGNATIYFKRQRLILHLIPSCQTPIRVSAMTTKYDQS